MANTSIQPPTNERGDRITRGVSLYREHGHEIADVGDGFYLVPSNTNKNHSYLVDLQHEVCDCPDRNEQCKHLIAATIARAKLIGGGFPPEGKILGCVAFEVETLDGVWIDGITALVRDGGEFLISDYWMSGDKAGEEDFLDGYRSFERAVWRYEEITGSAFEGVA